MKISGIHQATLAVQHDERYKTRKPKSRLIKNSVDYSLNRIAVDSIGIFVLMKEKNKSALVIDD